MIGFVIYLEGEVKKKTKKNQFIDGIDVGCEANRNKGWL